ncbi:hypothetical protein QAD02_012027 [Eretmocerus hayati]|uniref:Uncharacterized protein n=1 Tax=Eretmocerus hayati TaxID=131215 RepID=A0ACC2P081_9HYME|nr:hypothetical protein QAD02_012027 [Eretmocerus hayati]
MSQDIRNFFISSKPKTVVPESKPQKKKKVIVSDDDDIVVASPPKSKQSKSTQKKNTKVKGKDSKKRVIESSDEEDSKELQGASKSKKAKEDRSPEKSVKLSDIFNKKPVSRVNAVKIPKKSDKVEKSSSKKKTLDAEKDDFDATLDQLDTSKIEEEYLAAALNSHYVPVLKDKKDGESKQKNGRASIDSDDEFAKSAGKNKGESSSASETKTTSNSTSKQQKVSAKNSPKKVEKKTDKNRSHPKLEVNQKDKSDKSDEESKGKDYNDIIEENIEKKKQHRLLYQSYLNRGGARNPGSKEVPVGAEQCLADLSFLITGVLDSLEREEVEGIIKQYGGKILHSVSRKLDYIIVGDEPGPSKLAKAESLSVKKLSEDDFLDLLRSKPGKSKNDSSVNLEDKKRKRDSSGSASEKSDSEKMKKSKEDPALKEVKKSPAKVKESITSEPCNQDSKKENSEKTKSSAKGGSILAAPSETKSESSEFKHPLPVHDSSTTNVDCMTALVEKYRPKEMKQIIGQTGDKSNAKKLYQWLSNWFKYHGKDATLPKPKFSMKDDTGRINKAALLSGPPGIGKTTTAYVVCNQLGYEVVEFNASDTRSKKLLQDQIAGILSNKTVNSLMKNSGDEAKTSNPRHVLLMDEVDGMAGNEDRGGMQELISFIKSTEVPIICICNDRNSQKIKSLANYTFDLRFQKPRLEQIRAAMMSVCFKEGVKIKPEELTAIIQSTNQDIRQVINHIAILSASSQAGISTSSSTEQKLKNLRLGPWDVVRKVFSSEEHKKMSIHDKSDLFFHDYNIAPLFVQENYPFVTPSGPKNQILDKLASCSESLALGDMVEKTIRSSQSWNLLPIQAVFSSVLPGSIMSGFFNCQTNFPSWLGKNSRANKCDRLLQDITIHARISTGVSKEAINLDYLKMLVDSIVRPLAVDGLEGVDNALEVMNKYHLTREDLDSLVELNKWPHTRDPMQSVDTKIKTAFTRAYNKCIAFGTGGTLMKKRVTRSMTREDDFIVDDDEDEEEVVSESEEFETIETDKLVKAKVSKTKAAPSDGKSKAKKPVKNGSKAQSKKK